jgi:hypothetical protein
MMRVAPCDARVRLARIFFLLGHSLRRMFPSAAPRITVLGAMTEGLLQALIIYAQSEGRVCPMPSQWNALWELLPDRSRVGYGWKPALPLILAAWWETSVVSKRQRLAEHIDWAAEHGALLEVEKFLRDLPEVHWLHEGEPPA